MSNVNDEPDLWNFDAYLNRLGSYNDDWKVNFMSPMAMAFAGLTYTGFSDRVKCLYCNAEFDGWKPDEKPIRVHRETSPSCTYLKNIPGTDVCGIMQVVNRAKYTEKSMIEVRLNTFNKCNIKLKHDFYDYAKAGFFYAGDGTNDCMVCFCCIRALINWDEDDDPWIEHARWSQMCSFVLLSKGREFVERASGNEPQKIEIDQLKLTTMINRHNESTAETTITVNAKNNKALKDQTIDVSGILAKMELKESDKKENPDVLHESIMCKICYKQEMNIAFMPCRHVLVCIECALTSNSCPLCRKQYTMVIKVFIKTSKEKDENLKDLATNTSLEPANASQDLMTLPNPTLCKVCNKEEMQILFAFCRHIYACAKCAEGMNECPECSEKIHATIQVYL